MAEAELTLRRFHVLARHLDRHHGRTLEEASFEAAAVAYIEDLHERAAGETEIMVIVRDLEGGHEHCFTIDLETGEPASCR